MAKMFKLVAVPHLLSEGDFKSHLKTVTFIAANEDDSHKWWAVNTGTLAKDFSEVVSPELAAHMVEQLASGATVEFPNQYALEDVKFKFGGRWS